MVETAAPAATEDDSELVTQPLRASSMRRRPGLAPTQSELAVMSRPRFVCFQMVTLLTAIITCFTLLAVALLKNEELQNRLLNLGQAANCVLNATASAQNDPALLTPDPEPANLNNFLLFLLNLSKSCAANSGVDQADSN